MGTFSVKGGIKKGDGLDLGAGPPRTNLCWVLPSRGGELRKVVTILKSPSCKYRNLDPKTS